MASYAFDAGDGASSEAVRRGWASAVALISAILLIVLIALVAISNSDRDEALQRERQSYNVMFLTRAVDASMARAEAALGRFVISGDRGTGTIYFDEWRRAGRQIRELAKLTIDSPEQAVLVRQLGHLYAQRGEELAEPATRANFKQGMDALGLFYEAGKATSIPEISRILQQLSRNEQATLEIRSQMVAIAAARSNYLSTILSGLGLVVLLGAAALGWMTFQAYAQRRAASRAALHEAARAGTLEQAVAERTRELITANEKLRQEAATRAQAEAQLRQVQKMEAVGQLTGGIAHDFNNMLAVVIGGLDLARRRLHRGDGDVGRHIENAMEGANRAAALTRRLLAFARAEPLLPEGVDPGRLIAGMSELLDRTLGERIMVHVRGLQDLWPVWVDPHQLENAILNLAVNARDAMDNEGHLSIEAANVVIGRDEVGEAKPGQYVRITVTDDGCGMSPEILDRVFEPFFTTKPVGKGTGLGLSQIFGFVRQSGGEVAIQSEAGVGTAVAVYLPRHAAEVTSMPRPVERPSETVEPTAEQSGARILVVEDDQRVRVATVGALEELGYRPLPCGSAEEAMALLAEEQDIRLIVTDVVMPGMTGPELVSRVAPLYPEIGVLFVTGYVGDAGDAEQFAGYDVLRKPFTINGLARAIGQSLSRAGRTAEHAA